MALAIVAVALLAVLSGCAAGLNTRSESNAPPQPVDQEHSIARFENGWEGFIIIERAQLNKASRSDFDSAVVMFHEQAYEQAIDLLESVIKQSPGATAPHINLGMAYQQIGELEKAEIQFKAALELVPDHPVACNQYGMLLRKTGRFEEARNIYEQALARFPDYYPLHRNLGILYEFYLNDLSTALEHYELYSQVMQEDDKVKLWIADLRTRIGETD
jgi:tetratricopeptide (TPR) repeat protein